ncbi:hypothetical protein NEF87_000325 [Candidatus Lokiarchaeum ossiferum]|uniref:L-dopachrome isomerase n=1 Tax=Candidatus Lokiarchaeum ossiferum TaxID=2951803 RepID=A0ABY6HKJ6_9ARCH|nr:hypothetical protein NEF87_000325 [Candidatus Lokiarchaeum sp. B-35]
MPAVLLETNAEISDPNLLGQELSKAVAKGLSKPEKYVTVSIRSSQTMIRAGNPSIFAFIEIRSIGGFSLPVNNTLSTTICEILSTYGLLKSNIDVNFMDISPENWGKHHGTFG